MKRLFSILVLVLFVVVLLAACGGSGGGGTAAIIQTYTVTYNANGSTGLASGNFSLARSMMISTSASSICSRISQCTI